MPGNPSGSAASPAGRTASEIGRVSAKRASRL